jgi:hypothetical protein
MAIATGNSSSGLSAGITAMPRVQPDVRPTETFTENNFLRVHTFPDEQPTGLTLANVEHLFYGPDPQQGDKLCWQCKTVAENEPLSRDDAMFIARAYAKEMDIPVIYEAHEG